MEKIKNKFIENKLFIIVAVCIIITIFMPYTQWELVIGDDYEYHIARIQSIAEEFKLGNFPVKIHSQMANSYGYGSGLFYSNLFLYFPAMLTFFGMHVASAYKIFVFVMLCAMFGLCYYSLKIITGDSKSALIGTIIIMLSRNFIFNIYHRFAVGEYLGFMFILPIIAGMYDYIHEDFKKPWLLVLGFWGVINSHVITTVICIIFCLIYFLINIKSTIKNWKKFGKLVWCAIIVALLTASFWIPAIEQHLSQSFRYSDSWAVIGNTEYTLVDLLGNRKTAVGYMILILIPIYLYVLLNEKTKKSTKLFIITMFALMLFVLWHCFWKTTNDITTFIQFKWRLVGLITIFAGISLAMISKDYKDVLEKYIDILIIILLAISMFFVTEFTNFENRANIKKSYEDLSKEMYLSPLSIGGGGEYLPINLKYEKLYNPMQVFGDKGSIINISKNGLSATFDKEVSDTTFCVPYVYYYGYVAHLEKENGEIVPLEVGETKEGLVEIKVNENDFGKVNLWYNGTKIQKISYIITAFSYLGVVVIGIRQILICKKRK